MALKVTPEKINKWKEKKKIDNLVKAIGMGSEDMQQQALKALEEASQGNAVDELLEAAQHKNNTTRMCAVQALTKIKDPKAVPVLIKCLNDKKYDVRVEAVKALGDYKDERVVEPLLNAMPEEGDAITEQAAKALTKMGDLTVKPLTDNLNSSKPAFVRRISAEILGNVGNQDAIPALILALDDYYPEIPAAAENALVKIGKPALEAVIKELDNEKIASVACRIIGKIGDVSALDLLIKMLKSDNKEAVAEAAYALGRIGHAKALSPLMDIYNSGKYDDVKDDKPKEKKKRKKKEEEEESEALKINRIHRRIRNNVLFALGETGEQKALDVILDGLSNSFTRDTAIQSIIKVGDSAVQKALQTDEWFYKDVKLHLPSKSSPETQKLKQIVKEWEETNL